MGFEHSSVWQPLSDLLLMVLLRKGPSRAVLVMRARFDQVLRSGSDSSRMIMAMKKLNGGKNWSRNLRMRISISILAFRN